MNAIVERNHPKYPRRNVAEDRAWRRLYRDAGDPVVAAEIVRNLDEDARRIHLALYLRCRRTLRKNATRRIGWTRIAIGVARLARAVLALGAIRRRKPSLTAIVPHAATRAQLSAPAIHAGRIGIVSELTPEGLRTIEAAAERANAIQLRAYLTTLRVNRVALDAQAQDAADALTLKLERLVREQCVERVSRDVPPTITCDGTIGVLEEGTYVRRR